MQVVFDYRTMASAPRDHGVTMHDYGCFMKVSGLHFFPHERTIRNSLITTILSRVRVTRQDLD